MISIHTRESSAITGPPARYSFRTLDGFDGLASAQGELDSEGLTLPNETVGFILSQAKTRSWDFDRAWSAAINRVQSSQVGGYVDPLLEVELRESRALIEEMRPHFRAAYEGHAKPSTRELAESVAAAWKRIEGPVPSQYREDRGTGGHAAQPVDANRERVRNGANGRDAGRHAKQEKGEAGRDHRTRQAIAPS